MKKVFLFGASALLMLASCAGKSDSEKANEDDMTSYDQTDYNDAAVEIAADTAAEAVAVDPTPDQAAAVESQPEEDSFAQSIPNPKKIYWEENCGKYLKSLGFFGSTRNDSDGDTKGSYSLVKGNKSCKVTFECGSNEAEVKVTIDGDKAALDSFYKKAKKMAGSGFEWYIDVKKSGNTVKIEGGGA